MNTLLKRNTIGEIAESDSRNWVIELAGVTKRYGQGTSAYPALRGIDSKIRHAEFVAIMGPSGSGKSTAMYILGCLDIPTSGTYKFDGVPVETLSRDDRALLRKHFLGFIFQGFNLLPRTTALENVELPLVYRGQSASERKMLATKALADVGLSGWETHTAAELSGGQQQRVAIARALVSDPQVLLADEPTGNLDSKSGREIMELISSLNSDRGITVLVVTHDQAIADYAERIVRFVDGHIEADVRNIRGEEVE
jgi:putative ABC transport system ATP-binding protein